MAITEENIVELQLPKIGDLGGRNRFVCNHLDGDALRIEMHTILKERWSMEDIELIDAFKRSRSIQKDILGFKN